MARLALDRAPAASLPRRFLLSAPPWGMLAGVLLLVDGDALLRTRWQPGTLALAHVFALGVLGNVMFGSVLQFLPAAAGVRVRGGARLGPPLHAAFNLGVLLLVAGLHQGWRGGLLGAGVLLPLAFATLAAMTLPGLVQAAGSGCCAPASARRSARAWRSRCSAACWRWVWPAGGCRRRRRGWTCMPAGACWAG
ncbi:hypothetical protein [Rhodanobacter sp. FW106-PBR-LB-2-11]|uniref:hypothetical protein n=1 Tax=Rhodanobacter sp. FW106-PBR-LB-2-11 TaxID=1524463 RepID=UPI0034E57DF4